MIIGLTGGIGSGKTTVVNFFKEFKNVSVYIADSEAKNLMNKSLIIRNKIKKEFGEKAFYNNQLDRKYISNIVFKDKQKLKALNSIVHPEVAKHFKEFAEINSKEGYILYENAILFETNNNEFCDYIITVFAPEKLRISRVLERDDFSENDVIYRIKNQFSDEKKMIQSNYVIKNISLKTTKIEVGRIHKFLTEKY